MAGAGRLVLVGFALAMHGHLGHPARAIAGPRAATQSGPLVLGPFTVGWLVMGAAMMLPTTVPPRCA